MSDTTDFQIFTLSNGLKCVFRRSSEVGYCGIVVNAGSRDDGDSFGLAHFVEHTIFKGTHHRQSRHIASRMETVGGDLNAYTTKDHTTIYTAYPAGFSERALDLLSDLASSSTFPKDELEKEREVVGDEINLYLDNPAESIFDEFEDRLFSGTSLGHNILGTPESLKGLSSEKCIAYRQRYYVPQNMTLYCLDNISPEKALTRFEKYFGSMAPGERNERVAVGDSYSPFDEIIERDGHQAHTVMGTRIGKRNDDDRFALFLLNNHLGGPSMNSLLNREMRDKRGYVYTVDSSVSLMDDCGIFQIYFGCDREHTNPGIKIAGRLLTSLAESPMKPALFDKIRRQFLGQLIVGTDNRESRAIAMGKSLLYYGEIRNNDYTREQIMSLTPERLRSCAEKILSKGLSRLSILPTD